MKLAIRGGVEKKPIDHATEAERLIEFSADPRFDRVMDTLERQYTLLHNRGQVLLALCGILITSATIAKAHTGELVHVFLLMGSLVALLAAVVVVASLLRLNWMTQQPGQSMQAWVQEVVAFRDRKTRAYRRSTLILLVSLGFYQASIVAALAPGLLD